MSARTLAGLIAGLAVALALGGVPDATAAPMGTEITYQGLLEDGGGPITGPVNVDMIFTLYDAETMGSAVATDVLDGQAGAPTVTVTDGLFTARPDLGAGVFDGTALWLEIQVRVPHDPSDTAMYTPLDPRQPITAAPYALALRGMQTTQSGDISFPSDWNVIGGNENYDFAGVAGATISGGKLSFVTDNYATVSGGFLNQAGDNAGEIDDARYTTVGGGSRNTSSAHSATVGGGEANTASGPFATVAGGFSNSSSAMSATVGGGQANTASDEGATVAGGWSNTASDRWSSVAGGLQNQALGRSSFAAGEDAIAGGDFSTVPGGNQNEALGRASFAAGERAKANYSGTFVWADQTPVDFQSTGPNQFLIRAGGGVGINKNDPVAGALDVAGNGLFSGNVGVGTSSPERRLHVFNGSSGGTSLSTADLLVEDNGSSYISINSSDGFQRGIVFGSPASVVHGGIYYTNANGMEFRTNDNNTALVIDENGQVAIGPSGSIDAELHVKNISGISRPIKCDRIGSDGQLLAWARDDSVVGDVSVVGGAVSYNAFTGSHYAWMAQLPDRGMLVTLTGENRQPSGASEIVYGAEVSSRANDPACLGAYLAPHVTGDATDSIDEHQIMSVGNGEMWVVDSGRDIHPGDVLISSDIAGHAMLDEPERFEVGYIVARAAEVVDWSSVDAKIEGRRHKRISVFFDTFVRNSSAAAEIKALRKANAELEDRLAHIEAMLPTSPQRDELLAAQTGGAR